MNTLTRTTRSCSIHGVLLLALALLLFPLSSFSQSSPAAAELYSLEGLAEFRSGNSTTWERAIEGQRFQWGDQIRVGESSRVGIQFIGGGFVRLGSSAQLTLQAAPTGGNPAELNLQTGQGYFFDRSEAARPVVRTPTVSAAIRGTELTITASPQETLLTVIEGRVHAFNAHGTLDLEAGESAVSSPTTAPTRRTVISIADAVQWITDLPLVVDWLAYENIIPGSPNLRDALVLLNRGESSNGVITLESDPRLAPFAAVVRSWLNESPRSALTQFRRYESSFASRQAGLLESSLLLAIGEPVKARATLRSTLERDPSDPTAQAYQAITTLVSGGTRTELDSAIEALSRNASRPVNASHQGSIATRFALSLLYQSRGELDRAEDALGELSDSPYLLYRAAELSLGKGALDRARDRIDQARTILTDVGAFEALAGFVDFARGDIESAESNFGKARSLIPSSGQPSFGLALIAIRRNDLILGQTLLEQAVTLEPQNSSYRAYLGKLFYEQNDQARSLTELDLATTLDPNDPSPYLYRSLVQIAANDPVSAIRNLESSLARTGNRRIVRSQTLLDQDTAIQSSNLGRVYRILGFENVARSEAVRSLSRDYLNPTAHRLLGASETTIFQADTAFSERKISQLLAPLSINNLDLAASQSSLDEFSPAYEREETRSTFDLTYGSANDLGAAEGLVTTRGERVGLGLAASSAQLKGSSSGNYRRDYRAGATLQWQPRWNHQFILSGDGQFIDQRDSGFEEQDLETKSNSAELSYRWTLTPELTLLANLSRLHDEEDGNGQGLFEDTFSTQIFEGIVDSLPNEIVGDRTRDSESTLSRGELQFVWQSSPLTSILHLDNSDQEVDEDDDLLILSDELGELTGNDIALASSSNTTLSGSTVSWYNTLHLTEWVDLTLGISHEDTELRLSQIPPFTNDTVRSNRTSPRLGILLTPDSDWTVRASYTEGLRKLSFEDQFSLEPTQVGGFSQRYNDLPGTENRTLGIGVDWRGTRGTYLGASFVHRDLIESSAEYAREFIVDFDLEQVSDRVFQTDRFDTHLDQRFVRGYLYQILTERLVGAIDYQFSQQEIFDPQTAEDLSDHDLAATLRYFAPNGVFLYLRGRYRDQEVSSPFEEAVNDDVTLVDFGAGYRLPRRRGIFTVELQNLFDEEITLRQFDGFQTPLSSGVGVRAQFTVQF